MSETLARHADRFWSKVRRSDGCWEWQGSVVWVNSRHLYGRFWDGTRLVMAHRYSWSLAFGPVPADAMVCHRCDNPKCVRPDHLFIGTAHDNMADSVAKGRHTGVSKTHCIYGHEFTPENTRLIMGRRNCRACAAAWEIRNRDARNARRNARRAAARAALTETEGSKS